MLFLLLTLIGLGMAEASGLTNLQGIVIHLFSREGTLVVEVDDPGVSVTLHDENLVIKGAGLREIRIDAGRHLLQAKKDGKVVKQEVVSIEKDGRKIVKISTEPSSPPSSAPERVNSDSEWEKSVAGLPPSEQVAAVVERLKKLNRRFDGSLKPSIEEGVVRGLDLCTHYVSDISPLSAFRELKRLNLHGDLDGNLGLQGELVDLSPLRGLRLTTLNCICSPINDLSPLQGMPLAWINVERTEVTDLSPLQGMPLEGVNFYMCRVGDLSPLRGMRLKFLMAIGSVVSDLSPTSGMPLEEVFLTLSHVTDLEPLRGAPLKVLWCNNTRISSLAPLQGMKLQQLGCEDNDITDLSPLSGMPLTSLTCHNSKITDHSPLAHLPLRRLMIDFDAKRDAEILRGIATLEEINRMPATEFWKNVAEKN